MFGRKRGERGERNEPLPEPNDGPPDSHLGNGLCPRCERLSSFQVLGSLPVTFGDTYSVDRDGTRTPRHTDQVSALLCRHCNQATVVVEEERLVREEGRAGQLITWRGVHWWPVPGANLPKDVPESIGDAFREAAVTLAVKCPRSSVVMAGRALEAVAVDKGETKGRLVDRLKALGEKGVLQPSLADWATEVRLLRNVGAHDFDPQKPVSVEDAKELLGFVRELLKYLYELPADLKRRRSTPAQDQQE